MEKEKFHKAELSPEEQNEFKGGCCVAEHVAEDVVNHNKDWGCTCWYNNRTKVTNTNDANGHCICTCV